MMVTSTRLSRRPVIPQSLLSVASHEIRGPIGVARGYLKLLQRDPALSEASVQAARGAIASIDRVVFLLDEMTEYARLIAGDVRLEPSEFSWLELLNTAASRAALPAIPRITWKPDSSLAEARVVVERGRMERALTTLVEAVSRAQVEDATLTATLTRPAGGDESVLDLYVERDGEVSWCAADIARGGLGFSLVLADAIIAAHGWRLTDRWQGSHWTGYRLAESGRMR